MPVPLPFVVTPEAESWLAEVPTPPEDQPGIVYATRYAVVQDGELVEKFFHAHFEVRHTFHAAWIVAHGVQMVIGTRAFWILPDTLDRLRGKTLKMIQAEVSSDLDNSIVRDFLVAA